MQQTSNVQKSLFQRAYLETEFLINIQNIQIGMNREEAWAIIKKPKNGFERFALKWITKKYVVPRKPFVLSEVMRQICLEWSSFNENTKYYYSNQ